MSPGYLTYFPSVSIDNVVVVNKPVCVDFPSIVMSRFTRTIRVPFFEFFLSKSNTKYITGWHN